LASQAIEKLTARADRAVATLKNIRSRNKMQAQGVIGFAEQVGGGVLAGAADAYLDEPQILGLPAVPLVSAIVGLVGLSEVVPGAEHFASLGAGGLAYAAGSATFKKVNEYETP